MPLSSVVCALEPHLIFLSHANTTKIQTAQAAHSGTASASSSRAHTYVSEGRGVVKDVDVETETG
jgi:hypothetical protein